LKQNVRKNMANNNRDPEKIDEFLKKRKEIIEKLPVNRIKSRIDRVLKKNDESDTRDDMRLKLLCSRLEELKKEVISGDSEEEGELTVREEKSPGTGQPFTLTFDPGDGSEKLNVQIRDIKKVYDSRERKIKKKSPFFRRKGLFLFLVLMISVIIWLKPVYSYNLGRREFDGKVSKRIVNLPVFITIAFWSYALLNFLIRSYYMYLFTGKYFNSMLSVIGQSMLIFGAISTYLTGALISSYSNKNIAFPVFEKNDLYSLKDGISLKSSTRLRIMLITLSVIPGVVGFNMMAFFFTSLAGQYMLLGSEFDVTKLIYLGIPLFFYTVMMILFAIPLLFAMLSARRIFHQPIARLIQRMKLVAKGDFSQRASVLSNDEIGMLRGHFNQMVEGLSEREKIRDTFGKFVSMEIAEKLMEKGGVSLEGEEIETTVMFTDIRNFTPFSETMTPQQLIVFLNKYFSYMCDPILKENGVINKFIGDSIMAVFSPVFGVRDHVDAALRAAIGIRAKLKEFNKKEDYDEIRHGVGLHTGILIAGNVGTDKRMEFTVIGDTVNIASRIESQTKVFSEDILISEDFFKKIKIENFPGYDFIPFEPVRMKGKSNDMVLYKVKEKA
ncbi:MAG: adenylate/guanylate cyclase domain-containing protein, partial [Candidatus Muiribacteriaceae bacterium]